MSNAVIPFRPDNILPAVIAQQLVQQGGQMHNPLTDGVGSAYANVSFKGKIFRIKYGGEEVVLVDPATNLALQYMDVVVLDAKSELSKTFYAAGYVEGVSEQPDCSSEDGVTPSAPVGKQVQCHDCRMCKWNAFGSKVSTDGKPSNSKACADTRKLAVVPIYNLQNERFGGPMLLRVPAASLTGLANFSRTLANQGAPFFAAVVRITFDISAAYPKLDFTPLRFLTDQEAQDVLALRVDPRTAEILRAGTLQTPAPALAAPVGGQVPSAMQAQPTQTPAAPVASAPPVVAAAAPALVPVPGAAHSIEQCRAGGWTDQQMIDNGIATLSSPPPAAPPAPPQAQYVPPPVPQPPLAPVQPTYAPQQPAQAPPQATAAFGPPPGAPPPPPVAQQAPGIPQTGTPPAPPAPQQAPQYAPPPQAPAPTYAPPPPPQQATQQYAPPPPPPQQPLGPASTGPVPQQVLSAVDQMLG